MSKKRRGSARRRKQQHARQIESSASGQTGENEAAIAPDDFMNNAGADNIAVQTNSADDETAPTKRPDREQQAVDLGLRFRQARERQGIELDEAARRMRLPWRVVSKLESGDWRGIDSPIYLQGYLRSYSDLLGMELPELIDELSQEASTPTPLVSSGGISRGRYLAQRYAVAGTYLVITALIVVPVLILGLNSGAGQRMTQIASLDPLSSQKTQSSHIPSSSVPAEHAEASSSADEGGSPLMASMAPVNLIEPGNKSTRKAESPATAAASQKPDDTPPAAPAHKADQLTISLSAPSWVEVTSAAGKRMAYALLDSGEHEYSGETPLTVRLGNAGAADVRMDGRSLDLSAYKRANVAYFRVDGQGVLHAPSNN